MKTTKQFMKKIRDKIFKILCIPKITFRNSPVFVLEMNGRKKTTKIKINKNKYPLQVIELHHIYEYKS
jgi:hypothetical protein